MTIDYTTIADQVAEMHRTSAKAPEPVREVFLAEQRALDDAGVPAGVAAVGSSLPRVTLLDAEGRPTSVSQVQGDRDAVIVFYRGAWCPYCNLTLRTYQRVLAPELEARGVALIAVSPQKPDGSGSMRDANGLTFAVLSDPGNQIAMALGIVTSPSVAARDLQRGFGLDLAERNADGTYDLPMPTVVVVDASGTIQWIDVHPNYTTRTEPGEILDALDRGGAAPA